MTPITLPGTDVDVPELGLSIGDAAKITGLAIDTLRYYERVGLMLDGTRRDTAGRRRYHAADLAWIGGLLMLRETGMSIADMRALAELSRESGTEEQRLAVLESHRERVIDELNRSQRHLVALEKKIRAYRDVVAPIQNEHDEGESNS
jgi:DNA-binding transcriptional MerR regulator